MLLYKFYCPNCVIRSAALACCLKTGAWSNNLCFFALLLSRHSFGLLPGAAASQHPLVPDQRHVVGRGALSGLSVAPAGLRALSPLHEPRGRRARLPHPPQARRVWDLHDKHTGWVCVHGSSADFLIVYHLGASDPSVTAGLFTLWVEFFAVLIINDLPGKYSAWRCGIDLSEHIWLLSTSLCQWANASSDPRCEMTCDLSMLPNVRKTDKCIIVHLFISICSVCHREAAALLSQTSLHKTKCNLLHCKYFN